MSQVDRSDPYYKQMEDLFPPPPVSRFRTRQRIKKNVYPALEIILFFIFITGILFTVTGFYLALELYKSELLDFLGDIKLLVCILTAASGLTIGLSHIAASEAIRVVIDIEKNTNHAAQSTNLLRDAVRMMIIIEKDTKQIAQSLIVLRNKTTEEE